MPVIKEVTKLWGREWWHHNSGGYCMKTLQLRVGAQSSLHYHALKRETFLCIKGIVDLEIGDARMLLHPQQSVTLEPGVAHRFRAVTAKATVIEASTEHDDADVYRIEESRLTEPRASL